jgi:hypothetical protein
MKKLIEEKLLIFGRKIVQEVLVLNKLSVGYIDNGIHDAS